MFCLIADISKKCLAFIVILDVKQHGNNFRCLCFTKELKKDQLSITYIYSYALLNKSIGTCIYLSSFLTNLYTYLNPQRDKESLFNICNPLVLSIYATASTLHNKML